MKIKIDRLYRGCIDVRDYVARKCYESKQTIEITVKGKVGKMLLTPDDIKSKVKSVSKRSFKSDFPNQPSYKLVSYVWKPNN